jgi:hypothetical protein
MSMDLLLLFEPCSVKAIQITIHPNFFNVITWVPKGQVIK